MPQTHGLRSFLIATVLLCFIPILSGAAYLGVQYLDGNFHEVDPGQLYRSGQLTADQIRDYTKHFGIRSIVNLRGRSDKSQWYRDEIAEAAALGVAHVDFKMSATRELSVEKADELEKILRDVPKPVLIHCQAGSDRSGLASAIFMHRIRGVDIEKAGNQISIYYGHFSVPHVSQAYPMDETWEKLEKVYLNRERGAKF